MSLEQEIASLREAINTNTEVMRQVLGQAQANSGSTTSAASADEEKPKATRGKGKAKEDKADADDATVSDDFKNKIAGWLGEFAKEEDKENPDGVHPEVTARRAALSKAFEGLGVKKLPEVTGENVARLEAWFEKAQGVDKGFGKGRLAADPEPAGDDGDDGLGI